MIEFTATGLTAWVHVELWLGAIGQPLGGLFALHLAVQLVRNGQRWLRRAGR